MILNPKNVSISDLSLSPETLSDSCANPFDPARLRLHNGHISQVKKILLTVPVHKPPKQAFIRTHPDPDYRLTVAILELKETREYYIIAPEVYPSLITESTVAPRILITAITRQGSLFLWPLRLPKSSMKTDRWAESALAAADIAREHWVRIMANMQAGSYDAFKAPGYLPEPTWPETTFPEILSIAFNNMLINTTDHSVLRRLRGEE